MHESPPKAIIRDFQSRERGAKYEPQRSHVPLDRCRNGVALLSTFRYHNNRLNLIEVADAHPISLPFLFSIPTTSPPLKNRTLLTTTSFWSLKRRTERSESSYINRHKYSETYFALYIYCRNAKTSHDKKCEKQQRRQNFREFQ